MHWLACRLSVGVEGHCFGSCRALRRRPTWRNWTNFERQLLERRKYVFFQSTIRSTERSALRTRKKSSTKRRNVTVPPSKTTWRYPRNDPIYFKRYARPDRRLAPFLISLIDLSRPTPTFKCKRKSSAKKHWTMSSCCSKFKSERNSISSKPYVLLESITNINTCVLFI